MTAIFQTTIEEKIEMARQAERAARQYDRRISLIERAGYEDGESQCLILNSRGIKCFCLGQLLCGSYVFAVARKMEMLKPGFH